MHTPDNRLAAPLGVCVLPSPAPNANRTVTYPHYLGEILGHAGLGYQAVAYEQLEQTLPELRLLVTVGECTPGETLKAALKAWVEAGGAWISIAGTCALPELFGVEAEAPSYSCWGGGLGSLGEGYLDASGVASRIVEHLRIPLHYFSGLPVRLAGGKALGKVLDAHQRPTERAALVESRPGKGHCLLIAPDLTGAVVRIQQGVAITRDGVAAPDGTAPVSDGVLKSDDGAVLDWIFDRQDVQGVPGFKAFLEPVADQWRELLLRAIFQLASEHDVALALLWLYPNKLSSIAHLSHDTDGNDPSKGWKLLEVVNAGGISSTWCTIMPGYPGDLTSAIREAGHELAMHYDAMSEGKVWGEGAFDEQWKGLIELFSGERPTSNKNHYLRWEGDTEFFDWCAARGITLDESKGASKTGEAGFGFGTCHPYFPLNPQGEPIDVLELCTPTQDLEIFAPSALLEPLMGAVERHHGVLHLLFHPAHIDKPGVAEILSEAVAKAKARGMEWWTSAQLSRWERARRALRWMGYSRSQTKLSLHLAAGETLCQATLLVLGAHGAPSGEVNAQRVEIEPLRYWGFDFHAMVVTLQKDNEYECAVALEPDAQLVK